MNRPPGPSDFWWAEHQQNCNGQFIKIKEPENFKSRSKQNDRSKPIIQESFKKLTDWFTVNTLSGLDGVVPPVKILGNSKLFIQTENDKPSTSKDNDTNGTNSSRAMNEKEDTQNSSVGLKKLGSSSNNVHGWGISGPSGNMKKDDNAKNVSKNPKFSCSGILGGSNNGRSSLLTKFKHINDEESGRCESIKRESSSELSSATGQESVHNPVLNLSQPRNNSVPCPICNIPMTLENIYRHIDSCLINDNTSLIDEINNNINNNNNNEELMLPIRTFSTSVVERNVDANIIPNKRLRLDNSNETVEYVTCPVCSKRLPATDINQHLDECLLEADAARKAAIPSTSRASYIDNNVTNISSSSSSDLDDSVLIEEPKAQSCTSTSTCKNDAGNLEQKCLVCNAQIAPEISLNEHLEECIGSVFNDDTMMIDDNEDDNDDTLAIETNSTENKYPCPVCMQIILENLMNQHLDMCLKNE